MVYRRNASRALKLQRDQREHGGERDPQDDHAPGIGERRRQQDDAEDGVEEPEPGDDEEDPADVAPR